MKRLHKFLRLTSAERYLLIRAACLLASISLGLRLLPFATLRRLLTRVGAVSAVSRRVEQPASDRIVWAVATASRCVPGARTCLPQALAAQVMLQQWGYPVRLRIGVTRDEEGSFQAHAWVESQGRVVIGGSALARYTALPTLDRRGRGHHAW
jgi:hypothetical protein